MNEQRSQQVMAGVFLIGLAILFLAQWFWWPGIMFVIGAALIARTVSEGKPWTSERGGLVIIAIGVLFGLLPSLNLSFSWWPLLLIALGVYLLFGNNLRAPTRRSGGRSRDDLV
jgi:hypothetical protein